MAPFSVIGSYWVSEPVVGVAFCRCSSALALVIATYVSFVDQVLVMVTDIVGRHQIQMVERPGVIMV